MPTHKRTQSSDAPAPPRRRMSPEDRKEAIVSAAVELFAENGFDGSTRDLARGAGITQPLLYRYFPSKESLIEISGVDIFYPPM